MSIFLPQTAYLFDDWVWPWSAPHRSLHRGRGSPTQRRQVTVGHQAPALHRVTEHVTVVLLVRGQVRPLGVAGVTVATVSPAVHHDLRPAPGYQHGVRARRVNQVGAGRGHGHVALGSPGAKGALAVNAMVVPLVHSGGRAHVTQHLATGAGRRGWRGQSGLRGEHDAHLGMVMVTTVMAVTMRGNGGRADVIVRRHVRHVAWRHVTGGDRPAVVRGGGFTPPLPPHFFLLCRGQLDEVSAAHCPLPLSAEAGLGCSRSAPGLGLTSAPAASAA